MEKTEHVETEESAENGEPSGKRQKLSDEEYQVLRKRLKEKKKTMAQLPLFRLVEIGLCASLKLKERSPILPSDVQSLLAYAIVGDCSTYQPFRWCKLIKWTNLTHTVVLAVDGISVEDVESNPDLFSETLSIFEDGVEMANPALDGLTMAQSLAYVPLSIGATKRLMSGFGSVKKALKAGYIHNISELTKKMKNSAKTTPKIPTNEVSTKVSGEVSKEQDGTQEVIKVKAIEETRGCSRMQLLLSAPQLISEHYPVPGIDLYKNFQLTNTEYQPVTDKSPMYSIDCEWCQCIGGAKGLARVAVVDEDLKEVYHTFVKPKLPIVDYLTKYSGITKALLKKVRTTEEDVRRNIKKLLPPDAIIVGQTVSSDLIALKLIHPYIIDTSIIFNLTGYRTWKSKLSLLCETFLNRHIQKSLDGHNPIEDAIAAMELVVLKLQEGLLFGDAILTRGVGQKWEEPDTVLKAITRQMEKKELKKINEDDDATFDSNTPLHMKLFTFIQTQNKEATLIAHPSIGKEYQPKLTELKTSLVKKKEGSELVKAVEIHEAEDLKSSVKTTLDHILDHNFTMIHSSIEDAADDEAQRQKKMKKADKYIGKLFRKISLNGMLVVVFGGSTKDETKNGACFVRINKPRV